MNKVRLMAITKDKEGRGWVDKWERRDRNRSWVVGVCRVACSAATLPPHYSNENSRVECAHLERGRLGQGGPPIHFISLY